jgi:uncharacterized protein YbjT (DUF2867 family)
MIFMVGATGILGGTITQQLLEKRQDVRILVRTFRYLQTLEPLLEVLIRRTDEQYPRASKNEECGKASPDI